MSAWLLRFVGVLLMATALVVALSRAPDRPVEASEMALEHECYLPGAKDVMIGRHYQDFERRTNG